MLSSRDSDIPAGGYISAEKEVNIGLWSLFGGATIFLGLRIWCKVMRRTGLWYDDYVLILSWMVLMVTDTITAAEWHSGYVSGNWNDRMHILINISSCGTLIGQAWSKTALGITLLRISNRKQMAILWFCIGTMNLFMILKVFFQWAKYCGRSDYQQWYRLNGPCIAYKAEERIKVGGNTYNIIMDFVFALFPWWITWSLEMHRLEKIALCSTMSLGMLIAVISAVRTTYWVYRPIMHVHDQYYIWRNGISSIWYSAEVAGTIMVQCVPILRPLLRDMRTTLSSRKTGTEHSANTSSRRSRRFTAELKLAPAFTARDNRKKGTELISLEAIKEESVNGCKTPYSTRSGSLQDEDVERSGEIEQEGCGTTNHTPAVPSGPLTGDSWRLSGSDRTEMHSSRTDAWMDIEQYGKGLSPPPKRSRPTDQPEEKFHAM